MPKANKVQEGVYRTDDGLYEIVQYGEQWLVNERRSKSYVTVGTAKTLSAAEKELNKVAKTDEETEPVVVEPVVEETEEA